MSSADMKTVTMRGFEVKLADIEALEDDDVVRLVYPGGATLEGQVYVLDDSVDGHCVWVRGVHTYLMKHCAITDAVRDAETVTLPVKPVHPVGTRVVAPSGGRFIKTDDGDTSAWFRFAGRDMELGMCVSDEDVEGWEVIRDVPEVPDDVIEAAARAIYRSNEESWLDERDHPSIGEPYLDTARALADAGLLVGTVPKLPEGHYIVNLSFVDDYLVRNTAAFNGVHEVRRAFRAEAKRRGLEV